MTAGRPHRWTMPWLVPLLAVAVGGMGCTFDITVPVSTPPELWDPGQNTHPDSAAFRELLEDYARRGLPGVVLLVRSPEGTWNGSAGYARLESATPLLPSHLFHAASVTKTYVAAATLLLAENDVIDLDEEIQAYLPEAMFRRIPNGTRATVRQLLAHRSGIPDFSGDASYDLDFLNDPFGSYPTDRLLSYLEGQRALFSPGEGYFYSNANYYILALVLDRVEEGGHAAAVRDLVVKPLELRSTCYRNDPGYPSPPGLVNGYQDLVGDGTLMNVTDLARHAAGVFMGNAGLITNSADLADFLDALLGGGLLAPTSLSAMTAWSEPSRYGLGLGYLQTPYGRAVGHSGGDVGALAQARCFPDSDVTLILLSNGGDGGLPDELFQGLWEDAVVLALEGS